MQCATEVVKVLGCERRSFVSRDGREIEYTRVRIGCPDYTAVELGCTPDVEADLTSLDLPVDARLYVEVTDFRGKVKAKLVGLTLA